MKFKTVIPPQCMRCYYLEKPLKEMLRCRAYPEGIPEEIIENRVDHRYPYAGDN